MCFRVFAEVVKLADTLGLGSSSTRVRVQIPFSVYFWRGSWNRKYIAQWVEQLAFNRKVLGSKPNILKH